MSLPSKSRTWYVNSSLAIAKPNVTPASTCADAYNRYIVVELVRLLVSAGSEAGVWTHVASSSTSTTSTSTNLWTNGTTNNYASLTMGSGISGYTSQPDGGSPVGTPAGAAGSWIVLKSNNFFDTENTNPLYMTLQLGKTGNYGACSIFLSRTQPTLTSLQQTIRPLPSDGAELTYRTGMSVVAGTPTSQVSYGLGFFGTVPFAGPWANQSVGLLPTSVDLHVARSAQGFRFILKTAEVPFFVGGVDFVSGMYSDSTDFPPVAMFWESAYLGVTALTTANTPITSTKYWKDRRIRMYRADEGSRGVPFDCYMTQECHGDGSAPVATTASTNVLSDANNLTAQYPLFPIGLASTCTGAVGRHGYIQDMYWGSDRHSPLAAYPSSGSPEWVQAGSILIPWDGSTDL